jgi:hypothetical protein
LPTRWDRVTATLTKHHPATSRSAA